MLRAKKPEWVRDTLSAIAYRMRRSERSATILSKALMLMVASVSLLLFIVGAVEAQDRLKTPYVSWSPDGTMLAVGDSTGVDILDPVSMQVLNRLSDMEGQTTEPAWSSDGERLAIMSHDGITIWQTPEDPDLAKPAVNISTYTGIIHGICWSPDDTQLANTAGEFIDVWDTQTGEPIRKIEGDWMVLDDLVWTADNRLAVATQDSLVVIIDPSGEVRTYFIISHAIPQQPAVTAISFSPDGTQMAVGGEDFGINIWGKMGAGEVTEKLREDNPQIYLEFNEDIPYTNVPLSISWNSNGQYIAGGAKDGTVRIWDAKTGEELQTIQVATNTYVNSVAWSPDGTQLAYGKPDGTIEIIPAPAIEARETPSATETTSSG